MADLAVVIVHYHTPELLAHAVGAARDATWRDGIEAQIVVVDNGSAESARAAIDRLDVQVVRPNRNLGYAGGVNLGAARTDAPIVVAMNCDVEPLPRCFAKLVQAIDRGAAAAGPRLFWDRARTLVLPPTEERTRSAELARRMAPFSAAWARRTRQRWRAHARRCWLATSETTTTALSGALVAFRRDAWREEPFDEGYRLYFEETDWLARLAERGLATVYVPSAGAIHRYNQSAAREPEARRWFRESSRRFARRHYGKAFATLLDALEAAAPRHGMPGAGPAEMEIPSAVERPAWIEVSPSPLGFPAAGARLDDATTGVWRLPDEVWQYLTPGPYILTLVDAGQREVASCSFVREQSTSS